jgi:hypothetical protein
LEPGGGLYAEESAEDGVPCPVAAGTTDNEEGCEEGVSIMVVSSSTVLCDGEGVVLPIVLGELTLGDREVTGLMTSVEGEEVGT